MEYQYTTLATEFGVYYMVRVADEGDALVATGKQFRKYFEEAADGGSFAVVHRNEDGEHEFYGSVITDLRNEELDQLNWVKGEWETVSQ